MSADSQNAVRTSVTLTRCHGLVDDGAVKGQINFLRDGAITARQAVGLFSRCTSPCRARWAR